jgi:hypothetical protein
MRRIDSRVSAPESSTPSPISPASLSTCGPVEATYSGQHLPRSNIIFAPRKEWISPSNWTGSPLHKARKHWTYSRITRTGLTGSTPDSARLSTLPTDTASDVRGPAYSARVDIDIATGSGGHR